MRKISAGKNQSTKTIHHQQSAQKRDGDGSSEVGQPQGKADQILHLQKLVGNQAVQRLLHPPAHRAHHNHPAYGTGALVQRWGGDEHYEIGQAAGIQIDLGNGVVLDWGEVVGLGGDELGSPEELLEMTKTESGRARIRAALELEDIAGNGVKTLPAPLESEKDAQRVEYYTLLLDNVNHFQSQGKAVDSYRGYHTKALNAAAAAGMEHPNDDAVDLNPAYLQEAFGQHFLTDMFASGHIITPRSEINDYYVNEWAPQMVDAIIGNIKSRLVAGIYEQVADQNGTARVFPDQAKETIGNALDDILNEALGQLQGGKTEMTTYLGKGVAGVISGAIHDSYNVKGVQVSSINHPDTWVAYGDGHLDDQADKTNKEQAQLAVQAGLTDLQAALAIGQREGQFKQRIYKPNTVPDRVYFCFNSADIQGSAHGALEDAAALLAYRPDISLTLIGHTDPIGKGPFNLGLGQRRADSAANKIMEHAIAPARLSAKSLGKTALATTNPRKYSFNRRVEFNWKYPGPTMILYDENAIATQRIADAIAKQIGPPFPNVENYIPQVEPALNEPVPDWHWGAQSSRTLEMIDAWVKKRFNQALKEKILKSSVLAKRDIQGMTIDPKSIVQDWITEIDESPTRFLMSIFINPKDLNIIVLPRNMTFP